MEYKVTIGLEIHAELKTKTKMFCDSKNDTDEINPNVNICPICMGYPGTLPTINKEAIRNVLRVGLAVQGRLAEHAEFDRKNYFYPDIPKGYQISQYEHPLVSGGVLNGVALTRIHLEEDTARSTHGSGSGNESKSLVDFNRAGIPLMELVTEPVITSGKEAADFARELQLLLQYLRAGDANMEKGEMRVEANISLSKDDSKFGTKVEIKNLNSFKSVEKAIGYEILRQSKLLDSGENVVQETRGWNETKNQTFSQRTKEESHDYRYFKDPDLLGFNRGDISDLSDDVLKDTIPELPWQKRQRYKKNYEISNDDIETFIKLPEWADFFEETVKDITDTSLIKKISNYITSDLFGLTKKEKLTPKELKFTAKSFTTLIKLIADGTLSSRNGKNILAILYKNGGEPMELAEKEGYLLSINEASLKEIVKEVINEHSDVVNEYKIGKQSVLQYLIGQCIKKSKGTANPEALKKLLIEEITI